MVSTFIDAGILAIVVMASLPLLICRHLPHPLVIIVALTARRKAVLVALVMMALLQLMSRHLLHCYNGDCCSQLPCCR
jgi:hypothetical protein